ncbi:Alpha-ketoglutarate-dependent dioxygenase alkB like protein [Termitomyces sp. T112]|nr:Alpha-ketoglutarate-dependent dioxygenase alkB like protein [Termitomyces sp. T112]
MDSNDTDTLLALVASLLTEKRPDPDTILEALVQCDGDVEAAANLLNGKADIKTKKRKRVGLETWLEKSSKSPRISSDGPSTQEESRNKPPSSSTHTRLLPVVDLMSVLQPPPSPTKKKLVQLPPLLLTNPDMVAENTPCTLHLSVLPPELACKLFYTMIAASRSWSRNKWWLFDRVVESPHRTSFFAREGSGPMQEAAQHWYNGRMTDPPSTFPSAMEEACEIVERVVNEQLKRRQRFPLEWGAGDTDGAWRANVAASNCYEGSKESVGFHSDQLTYLGPYPTIASLSLGTQRIFSLREVIPADEVNDRKARTFNIPLPHNSLTIMHASCQERFKHSIPPQQAIDLFRPAFPETPGADIQSSNCRINITFRFYRPDFTPSCTPRCKCGIPTILRPDMKNRSDGKSDRYWWSCYAGAQNDGKGCKFWKVMDMKAEGRGSDFHKTYLRDDYSRHLLRFMDTRSEVHTGLHFERRS